MGAQMITFGCGLVRLLCTAADVVNEIDKYANEGNKLSGASVATRSTIFFLDAIELVGSYFRKISTNQGLNLKKCELVARYIDSPLFIFQKIFQDDTLFDGSTISKIRCIEQLVLTPLLDILRVGAERGIYQEKKYLEMTPEEREKNQRPIYEYEFDDLRDGIYLKLVGYRPIDPKECQENLDSLNKILPSLTMANVGVQIGTAEHFYRLVIARLICRFSSSNIVLSPSSTIRNHELVGRLINLRTSGTIPPEFADDDIFKKYICHISKDPILDPVQDPTADKTTYYERRHIINLLKQKKTSYVSGKLLTPSMLVECPLIKKQIDERLNYHEKELRTTLSNIFSTHEEKDALEEILKDKLKEKEDS